MSKQEKTDVERFGIEVGDVWETRCGRRAEIESTNKGCTMFPVWARVTGCGYVSYTTEGKYRTEGNNALDLVKLISRAEDREEEEKKQPKIVEAKITYSQNGTLSAVAIPGRAEKSFLQYYEKRHLIRGYFYEVSGGLTITNYHFGWTNGSYIRPDRGPDGCLEFIQPVAVLLEVDA